MAYKNVFICDRCGSEGRAQYPDSGIRIGGHPVPKKPEGWTHLLIENRRAYDICFFCSLEIEKLMVKKDTDLDGDDEDG